MYIHEWLAWGQLIIIIMIKYLFNKDILHFDKILSELTIFFDDPAKRDLCYKDFFKKYSNISDKALGYMIYNLAALSSLVGKIHWSIIEKDISSDKQLKLRFMRNLQDNLRHLKDNAKTQAGTRFAGDMFYNVNANKIHKHMRNDFIFSCINLAINREIKAYCKIDKIQTYCDKYKADNKSKFLRKGANFTNEHKLYLAINKTAHDYTASYVNRLSSIKTKIKDAKTEATILKSENKNFKNFAKNIIRTIFGITCIFGVSFWEKRQFKSKVESIKSIALSA